MSRWKRRAKIQARICRKNSAKWLWKYSPDGNLERIWSRSQPVQQRTKVRNNIKNRKIDLQCLQQINLPINNIIFLLISLQTDSQTFPWGIMFDSILQKKQTKKRNNLFGESQSMSLKQATSKSSCSCICVAHSLSDSFQLYRYTWAI